MQQIYSRRQIHDVATLGGMLVCAAVAKVLKTLLRHSRCIHPKIANMCHADDAGHGCPLGEASAPVQSSHADRAMSSEQHTALYLMQIVSCRPTKFCERLGNCNENGMPSSHTQLMAFAFVTYMLLVTRAPASNIAAGRLQRGFHLAQGAVLGLLVMAVAYSRIYLGYHSLSQVPLVSHLYPSAMQLMHSLLIVYGLLIPSCLSAAATSILAMKRWQHAPKCASALGTLSVAVACSHCCIYLRHPSLIKVPLHTISPCYHPRALTSMKHAADHGTMQDSVGPLPPKPALEAEQVITTPQHIQVCAAMAVNTCAAAPSQRQLSMQVIIGCCCRECAGSGMVLDGEGLAGRGSLSSCPPVASG